MEYWDGSGYHIVRELDLSWKMDYVDYAGTNGQINSIFFMEFSKIYYLIGYSMMPFKMA